jgi:hypothetical protein
MSGAFAGVIGVAVIGFLGLLMWAAQRGRPATDPRTGALLFRHSGLFRGFSLFMAFGIPLGITVLVLFKPPEKQSDVYAIAGIYGLFFLLSFPLLWESMGFALGVTDEGLDCKSPWRGRRFVYWDEVVEVSFSGGNFVIRAADGYKFRVSTFVPGLTAFLQRCERHLPPQALRGARDGYARVGRRLPDMPERGVPLPPWPPRGATLPPRPGSGPPPLPPGPRLPSEPPSNP